MRWTWGYVWLSGGIGAVVTASMLALWPYLLNVLDLQPGSFAANFLLWILQGAGWGFVVLWGVVYRLRENVKELKTELAESQQREANLTNQAERSKLVFQGNNDGIWDWNVLTNEVYFSSHWKTMLGFEDAEISNDLREWSKRVHPADLDRVIGEIQDHFDQKTPFYLSEHRVQCKDGTYKWMLHRGRVVRNAAGQATRMVGSHTDINHWKQSQVELQHSEARYRQIDAELRQAKASLESELLRSKALFQSSIDGIVVVDQQGNVVEASPSFADMLGYSLEKTLQLNVTDWDVKWTPEEITGMLTRPKPFSSGRFETRHKRKDGTIYDVEISRSWVKLGEQFLNYCICRDISDRKRAEAKQAQIEARLRQSEATQQAIIQAIPDLLIRMKSDGSCLEWISDSDFNIFDQRQAQGALTNFDVLPPDLARLRMHYVELAMRTGIIQTYEHDLNIDQKQCHEEVRVAPMANDEVLVMVRDITQRKHTEDELRQQKDMLQTIIAHMPVMLVLFDAEGQILMVNPELENLLGWTLQDCQTRDVMAECYPDPVLRQSVLDHMAQASGQWKDMTMVTAQGGKVEASWVNVPLANGMGLGIGQDISDRKQKELALKQAIEVAEAANQAKSMFLASMSHELRTPLNIILGFTQLLRQEPPLTADQQDTLQTIHRSGEHLLNLINDVLDFSKIEAGQATLETINFDLPALLHTLGRMFEAQAAAKGLTLTLEIAPTLPRYISSDEQKLRQVLLNLLSNAIKYTERGQVTLAVQPLASDQSASNTINLQFRVADTGVGIASEEIDSIFDAFVQAKTVHATTQGTGLGLAICQKLVSLMGGELSLTSQVGVGSTFTVTLPVAHAHYGHTHIEPGAPPIVQQVIPEHWHRRILVVDDLAENRLLLVRLLKKAGLQVREASSGAEAIQAWQSWKPELIWMDMRMPDLDGYEATRQIRAMEERPTTVIIALTAQACQSDDRTLAIEAGCNDYMSKPFQVNTIFLKMANHLGLQYLNVEPEVDGQGGSQNFPQPSPQTSRPPPPRPTLDPSQFSPGWLTALEEAVICGDDSAINHLADQLCAHQVEIATHLKDLANQYQFEQILDMFPKTSHATHHPH
jgi:two-component system sensor histidine kinase/response regulator